MNVALLISGGVDSSVALVKLIEAGHDVTAFYLKIWLEDELAHLGTCPWQQDLNYVTAVCEQFDIPLEILPLQRQYWDEVVAYTIAQIKQGFTPNPDVMCNQRVKFGAFMRAAGQHFDAVATGHYAQTIPENGLIALKQSPDPIKDQTYFLAQLSQAQLQQALFPIGHLTKQQVRLLASQYDLATKDRKDSQGICFLGKLKFTDFVRHHVGTRPGSIVELETGNVIGSHDGVWFYTIGQRQGMGLGGGPWYVVAKNIEDNTLIVSRTYHAPEKKRDTFHVGNIHWIAGQAPATRDFLIKLRHGPAMVPATLVSDGTKTLIKLANRDQGIAPGQFAVFYEGTICRGSAPICHEGFK